MNGKLTAVDFKLTKHSMEPAAPRELFPLPTRTLNFIPYDVSEDGDRFLVQARCSRCCLYR
ncbi:MAG TPA: hypothetical protein VK686_16205 [Bryobacteraceae bacterium]|nr:hypothetical protein [Bryobacteraceae bacterium]